MTTDDLRRTEEFLHGKIPLTRAMGIRVVANGNGFAIEAPVALNYNHMHTAFGGSINAVATIAAYAFLWLHLNDGNFRVVVRESRIRFFRPIRKAIAGRCERPGDETMHSFDRSLLSKGKARLEMRVMVEEQGSLAAEFFGTFVAVKNQ